MRKLTQKEWWSLCAAVAERAENLSVRAEEQSEATGRDAAALDRALEKVREQLAPSGRWNTSR